MTAPASVAIRVRLLRGSYFGMLGTLVSVVGNFTATIILARLLEPAGLGTFGIYLVIGAVAIPLLSLAIPSAVTKYLSEMRTTRNPQLHSILATSLWILLASGMAGSLLIVFFIAPFAAGIFREPQLLPMLEVMGALAVANLVALYGGAILQGLEEFADASVLAGLTVLTNVGFLLLLVPRGGLLGAVLAAGASVLANVLLGVWLVRAALRRHGITWRWRPAKSEAWLVGSFVAPLNIASLVSRGSILVQNSLVAVYIGFVDLGYLRVAGFFYNALLFLPRTLLAPMLPVLSSMVASRTPERRKEILGQLLKSSLLMLAPLSAGLILALPFAIEFLYGAAFLPSIPFALVFIAAGLAAFPSIILGDQYLVATGRTKVTLLVTAYTAGLGLALVIALFPSTGAMALPISTLVTEASLLAILLTWLGRIGELEVSRLLPAIGFVSVTILGSMGIQSQMPPSIAALLALPAALLVGSVAFFVLMDGGERATVLSAFRRSGSWLRGQRA